jgi:hypothetical protein
MRREANFVFIFLSGFSLILMTAWTDYATYAFAAMTLMLTCFSMGSAHFPLPPSNTYGPELRDSCDAMRLAAIRRKHVTFAT